MSDPLSFTMGDGKTQPKVSVAIIDLGGGKFTFTITQDCSKGNLVGDLRGFYIDWKAFNPIANPTISNLSYGGALGTYTGLTAGQTQAFVQEDVGKTTTNNDVSQVGNQTDTNMNGADGTKILTQLTGDAGFDMGMAFGTSGVGKDDVQNVSFTLNFGSSTPNLSDFASAAYGFRFMSVGTSTGDVNGDHIADGFVGGTRDGSFKEVGLPVIGGPPSGNTVLNLTVL